MFLLYFLELLLLFRGKLVRIELKIYFLPKFIANKLNKTFVRKGPNLASKLPKPKKCSLSYLKNRVSSSMEFKKTKRY